MMVTRMGSKPTPALANERQVRNDRVDDKDV